MPDVVYRTPVKDMRGALLSGRAFPRASGGVVSGNRNLTSCRTTVALSYKSTLVHPPPAYIAWKCIIVVFTTNFRASLFRCLPWQINTNITSETSSTAPSADLVVPKTVYSSKLRLVYLVGLEGTGHHYVADVLDHICTTAKVICPKTCVMAQAMYPGLGNPRTPTGYADALQTLRHEMQELKAAGDRLPDGKATMVSFGKCREAVGMMSYPNFDGDHKGLQYVDFRILAEEAERAGVDLRLIYLTRPALDVVVSDTVHHRYGST